MKKSILVLAAMLPLAGCISFGATPPDTLLTLTSSAVLPIDHQQDSDRAKSIVVQVPVTPASIAGLRVPVQATPTSLAYVKNAQWSEPPARLFARLMADTVSARTGRVVLSQVQAVTGVNDELAGELRNFGFDATTHEAVVTFDGALSRAGRAGTEKQRFEVRVPVAVIDAMATGPALNQAANQVAVQVAAWVGR